MGQLLLIEKKRTGVEIREVLYAEAAAIAGLHTSNFNNITPVQGN